MGRRTIRPSLRAPRRCGLTLFEVACTAAIGVLLLALVIPILSRASANSERLLSLRNLMVIGEAHACYAADWDGRQFSTSPRLLGTVNGDCWTYIDTFGCPNPMLLGWDDIGAIWGYFLGCPSSYPGGCSNWSAYKPITFTGAPFGSFRLQNARGMQEYVGGRFCHPHWYSSLDTQTWAAAEPWFDVQAQFICPPTSNPGIPFSSYVASPAALFHPGVFRKPSRGGFRHPDQDFGDAYDAPAQEQCRYPNLKSRMIEHHWLVNPPAPGTPPQPYFFNQGIDSRPGVLFFDGSVAEMTMRQAVGDDAAVLQASGGIDGLWSRDTPFGSNGYFGANAVDETRNSFHILTTEGILGRDFLRRGTPSHQTGARP